MENQEEFRKLYALTYQGTFYGAEKVYGIFTQLNVAEWAIVDFIQGNNMLVEDLEHIKIRHVKNGLPSDDWKVSESFENLEDKELADKYFDIKQKYFDHLDTRARMSKSRSDNSLQDYMDFNAEARSIEHYKENRFGEVHE